MRSQTRTQVERVVLLLSAISSIITIVAFTTGVPDLSLATASVRTYLSSLAADTPVVIRWLAQALAWLVWFAIVVLYRLAILFGLPLLPALPTFWIAGFWVRLRNRDPFVPLAVGFVVYFVALIWFIIALNSNRSFSVRLGMG